MAIFDRKDPRVVVYRSDEPVFQPEREWEKAGEVPNVVFVEGMFRRKDQLFLYYGAADKFIGVATATVTQSADNQQN